MHMRFSEAFSIELTEDDNWFDPHLTVDTKLFVDPLMLLKNETGVWTSAHDEIINHFAYCYELVAKSDGKNSISAKKALSLLTFQEPFEIGLGYTASGTRGSGAGRGYAKHMLDGIAVALAKGLEAPEHIEEIGILNEGIGADRISDTVVNILKHRFIIYTQEIADRHSIPLETHRISNANCYLEHGRWGSENVDLPTNPETGSPILLVPHAFLNNLPTLNADDWFDSPINADVRQSMNYEVGKAVKKKDIVIWARKHPDRVVKWAREQTSRQDLKGYDFNADILGVYQWDKRPVEYAKNYPLPIRSIGTQAELSQLVSELIERFKHFIEDQRGWSLLFDSNRVDEKPEEAAQLLFLGMSKEYLRQFNVELDREVELGRGPVDFKVSSGASIKLLIEVKKTQNGKFWQGLAEQLPSYMESDKCDEGWFVAIQYRDTKSSNQRMIELPAEVDIASRKIGKTLHYKAIDARPKASASNIKNETLFTLTDGDKKIGPDLT